jgi:hypothetical protein
MIVKPLRSEAWLTKTVFLKIRFYYSFEKLSKLNEPTCYFNCVSKSLMETIG